MQKCQKICCSKFKEMSFCFKTITICCILLFNAVALPAKMAVEDPTKDLSDREIEMALNELSLSDLDVLSKLIDKRSNAADYDYKDYESRNSALAPAHDRKFDDDPFDDYNNVNYYDDIDEPARDARNSLRFKTPQEEYLPYMEPKEYQRTKRENAHTVEQQPPVDAEYIKQLEDSFPRDQEQNNHEEGEEKKEHIRVKRN